MICGLGFAMFESAERFNVHAKPFEDQYIFRGGNIKMPDDFPAFFQYQDSGDAHFRGWWVPCNGDEMAAAYQREIYTLQNVLNNINRNRKLLG